MKIKLIYNSTDTNFFIPSGSDERRFDILTACRLTTWKRVDELISLSSTMGLKLGVAGNGPEKVNLQLLAQKLEADVVFFGDISKEKLLNLFQVSRFFVLNSEYEGLPHVLIEARSSGVLSFARAGTGSSEVIHDKIDGYIYADLDELNQILHNLKNQTSKIPLMTYLARRDVLLRFDKNQNFLKIEKVLRALT